PWTKAPKTANPFSSIAQSSIYRLMINPNELIK
ncbi:MAG: hypothetical protein ACI9LA_000552, partial [Bacteroidia bacterium]